MNQLVEQTASAKSVAIKTGTGGSKIAPSNLSEMMRFAEVMSQSSVALPEYLRGNYGACLAVAMQAMEWEMSPFAVASKSYQVKGAIAYEAQLIAAVVNTRSGIKGRLKYEYKGEGTTLVCKVSGVLDGQECEYETPPMGSITTKNSPLWKSDPKQQLGYFAARSWARRHCPEVILGVYDRDEATQIVDVTPQDNKPTILGSLAANNPTQSDEGFDLEHVTQEAEILTGEQLEQNADDERPPVSSDVEGGDSGTDAALNQTPNDFDEAEWFKYFAKGIFAAIGPEVEVVTRQGKALFDERVSESGKTRARNIVKHAQAVCRGEIETSDVIGLISGLANMDEKELEA